MEIVEVHWLDSCRTISEWTPTDNVEPADLEPSQCRSVGFLYRMTTDELVLVQSTDDTNNNLLQAIVIPRRVVTKLMPLIPSHTEQLQA